MNIMTFRRSLRLTGCFVCAGLGSLFFGLTVTAADTGHAVDTVTVLPLADCIDSAMRQNRRRPASQFAVAIAEAQHRQALSGYWPHVTLKAAYSRMDEAPNFIFPAGYMGVPPQAITVPEGTAIINVPAGVFGPTAMQLPVTTPAQTITTAGQLFPIPAQDIKLMDPESVYGSINATWLLFDGGMRKGYREQASGLIAMMKADARRTDLEIVDTVKRYYYGAVLAEQLHQVGTNTLARMEATLSLTESLYKEGSGRVQKIDYLDNKIMVETLRAMVFSLAKNEAMARAALANAIGLPWQASIRPADRELPAASFSAELGSLVGSAYQFNPDWTSVEAGLRALEGAVTTARSAHAPKIALTGELHRWHNNFDSGTATARNKAGYTVALGVELPIFDGFLTRHKVAEARARVAKLKEEQFLLKDGIGLQIKDVFLGLHAAQQSQAATQTALEASQENRDLTTRAYQNDLVETEKMVRAQLVEALMSAQHLKSRYDLVVLQSRLALLVGSDLTARMQAP